MDAPGTSVREKISRAESACLTRESSEWGLIVYPCEILRIIAPVVLRNSMSLWCSWKAAMTPLTHVLIWSTSLSGSSSSLTNSRRVSVSSRLTYWLKALEDPMYLANSLRCSRRSLPYCRSVVAPFKPHLNTKRTA